MKKILIFLSIILSTQAFANSEIKPKKEEGLTQSEQRKLEEDAHVSKKLDAVKKKRFTKEQLKMLAQERKKRMKRNVKGLNKFEAPKKGKKREKIDDK